MILPLLFVTSGCATHKLWNENVFEGWNAPSPNPHLQLFQVASPKDFLVTYDECSERHDKIRRRAYLLLENQIKLSRNQPPSFIDTNSLGELSAIPIFPSTSASNLRACTCYAVSTNNQSFTLYSGAGLVVFYQLPIYNDGYGKIYRTIATPVTVMADLTVIGGCIFWDVESHSPTFFVPWQK